MAQATHSEFGFAVAPNKGASNHLTPGKAYPVLREGETPRGFIIEDDDGDEIYCLWTRCAHLGGRDWVRLEALTDAPTVERDQ